MDRCDCTCRICRALTRRRYTSSRPAFPRSPPNGPGSPKPDFDVWPPMVDGIEGWSKRVEARQLQHLVAGGLRHRSAASILLYRALRLHRTHELSVCPPERTTHLCPSPSSCCGHHPVARCKNVGSSVSATATTAVVAAASPTTTSGRNHGPASGPSFRFSSVVVVAGDGAQTLFMSISVSGQHAAASHRRLLLKRT